MSKKIYLDTNIYLDYLLERKNLFNADMSEKAFSVFHRTFLCEFEIVLSDWTSQELLKTIEPEKFLMLLNLLKAKKKLHLIRFTVSDIALAKKLSEHYHDPLHAILAEKGNAEFVVTRDKVGFQCCEHILKAYLPEEI